MSAAALLNPVKELPESAANPPVSWFSQNRFECISEVGDGERFRYDIYLQARAFESAQCVNWFGLLSGIPDFWQQLEARHPGRITPAPRLSALCSNGPAGEELTINQVLYTSVKPPALVSELWLKICAKLDWKQALGHVVALRFSDGMQSVGYHNWEPEPGPARPPGIAYLWLGASRPVLFRNAEKKITKRYTFMDGTLFVALPDSWDSWQFQVPKSKGCHAASILLIFK
jgi:hypothetical protein